VDSVDLIKEGSHEIVLPRALAASTIMVEIRNPAGVVTRTILLIIIRQV
jgi:hypothetical protein